jgi:hypothetical protein
MIDEAELERLLRAEADGWAVPPDGPDDVLAAAASFEESRRGVRWAPWLAAAAALVALVVALPRTGGVGGVSDDTASRAGGGSTVVMDGANETRDDLSEYDAGAGSGGKVAPADPAVVRTGEVFLTVPKARVADALREARRVAGARGGFVAESQSATSGDEPNGYVVVRVPVAEFDRAVEELSRLGDVRSLETRGEDVTDQVTDTAARLKSLTATRDQLRALLAKAKDVGEVLAVQQRMTEVQTQIEQLEAKRESLADRTAFGTVRVSVYPPGAMDAEKSGFAKAWADAKDGFVGGFEALVAASGTIAFALVVGGVLLVAGRRAYRYWVRGTL